MPGPHCVLSGYSNGYYGLLKWRKELCPTHNVNFGVAHCICDPYWTRDAGIRGECVTARPHAPWTGKVQHADPPLHSVRYKIRQCEYRVVIDDVYDIIPCVVVCGHHLMKFCVVAVLLQRIYLLFISFNKKIADVRAATAGIIPPEFTAAPPGCQLRLKR